MTYDQYQCPLHDQRNPSPTCQKPYQYTVKTGEEGKEKERRKKEERKRKERKRKKGKKKTKNYIQSSPYPTLVSLKNLRKSFVSKPQCGYQSRKLLAFENIRLRPHASCLTNPIPYSRLCLLASHHQQSSLSTYPHFPRW